MPRFELAQLPTPLEFADRLTAAWGGPQIWIKRDDLTGFGVSGNKVRKLEYHLAAAKEIGATTLITCGAVQSNHCRATALVAARTGLACVVLLRSRDGQAPDQVAGNHLLQRLAGADARFITPDQWLERRALMDQVADEVRAAGGVPWILPEGASDRLGMHAFDVAMNEVAEQVRDQIGGPVTVWHASSSAGTTAGLALGAMRSGVDATVVGSSVGGDEAYLTGRVHRLLREVEGVDPEQVPFEILDRYIGLGYGRTTDEELAIQVQATRLTGLIWDPTYTGKALFALHQEIQAGRFSADDHVVFWHTGGGFAVFAHDFSGAL